jgi:neutral ceramidase
MKIVIGLLLTALLNQAQPAFAQTVTLRAGVAKIDITPSIPAWLTGYASRKTQATGILTSIWAKALVIEQNQDAEIIFVTVDVLGLSHEIVEDVFDTLQARYHIRRSQLLLNSSHTHSGPMIWPCVDGLYDFSPDDQKKIGLYTQQLSRQIVEVVDRAMQQRFPAKLYSGHGIADFAINRRNDIHPDGPTDHDVPVLKVIDDSNRTKAVLFGYSCHNTTLVDDNTLVNGDYAGFAQLEIESANPGAIGLFLMGCAGDQNPSPRGNVAYAQQHGSELAAAVKAVLNATMKPVHAPIRTDYENIPLAFRPFDKAIYQKDIIGDNIFLQRRAKLMLEAYNKGWSVDKLAYSIQTIRFNDDLCILGLSDEVVVDYDLLFKKMYPKENLYVAGYCNDVQCYIPSLRLLGEGGYEPDESMIYYGQPSAFADDVESRITTAAVEAMKKVGAKPSHDIR